MSNDKLTRAVQKSQEILKRAEALTDTALKRWSLSLVKRGWVKTAAVLVWIAERPISFVILLVIVLTAAGLTKMFFSSVKAFFMWVF